MAVRKARPAQKPENPFFIGTVIPQKYFCDRIEETSTITSLLENGNNVVLKAPRRLGKSSLINHILSQEDIENRYNTLYVDLLGTNNAAELMNELQKAFEKSLPPLVLTKERLKELPDKIKLEAQYNDLLKTGKLSIGLEDFRKISTRLDTLFDILEHTDRPNIVVFDEFQKVKDYPEPMTAILRSHIQRTNNTKFIFSGSSRRMLSVLFGSYNEPFYNSAESFDLHPIPIDKYRQFCKDKFSEYGKSVSDQAADFAYHLAAANTFVMQSIMKEAFRCSNDKPVDITDMEQAVRNLLQRKDQTYRETLSLLDNRKERNVLLAVALEGVATEMTSQKMISAYNLGAPSTVSMCLENLCDENRYNLLLKVGRGYVLQDKFFELWISNQYGILTQKFQTAEQQFRKEKELRSKLSLPKFPKP